MEQSLTRTRWALVLALLAAAAPAFAQKPDAAGGAAVASEPGRAAVARAAEISAQRRRHRQGDAHGHAEGTRRATWSTSSRATRSRTSTRSSLGDMVVARYVRGAARSS